jgi:hypothetical protein
LQLAGQLAEQPGHPVLLDVSQGGLVDARRAVVAAHRDPRPAQDVLAVDLVSQRMEPSFRAGLGRPVQHMPQCADPAASDSRQGGPSRISGTHRSGPPSLRVNEAAALPSPQVVLSRGSTGTTAASDCLPAPRPLPGSSPVIGRRWPAGTAARSGRGGPPQFPPPPSEHSAPSTAGSPSRLRFQDLHRFHGLHRDYRGSAPSHPLTTRQASLDAADRSVAPLLSKGLRRRAPTRPVSRPDRQPATGLPGDYPDRIFTGRRRRASDQVIIAGQPPTDALGARNFAVMATITAMLLASHRDSIDVLPALPADWPTGSVAGLRTRHRADVDIRWDDGGISELVLTARDDVTVTVTFPRPSTRPPRTDADPRGPHPARCRSHDMPGQSRPDNV